METRDVRIAAVSDPYRPSRRLSSLPHGHLVYAVAEDPQAIIVTRNPPFDVCPPILDELSAVLRSARSPNVILAGDFNAKHQLWGPMETDERGLQLAQFVLSSDLVPLNDATSLPTFETPYSASWIDVTFATPSVMSAGYEWFVGEDTTFSEHRLVELLDALRRETWFSRVSGASLASSDALDLVLSGFYALYTRLYTRHLRPARARPTRKPWFTPALAIERVAVAAKRRRLQRTRDPQMRVVFRGQYTSAPAAFRQNIREARDVHVRGYTLSCVRGPFFSEPFKEAFGRLRQFRCLPSLIAPAGTLTSTHLESASLLLHMQIAVDDPTTDEAIHASTRALVAEPYHSRYQDVIFTYSEVVDVLRNTPDKSAPGPDHISPAIMKALFKYHPRFFLMVFNAAPHLGYFPRCWRTARVSFIHKPGRPPERTSSYRPICVSSVFGKTLERLLNGRRQHFLHKRDLIHPRQFGFTKGRSSLLALHELNTHLLHMKAQRMPAVLMSLDFHGAFDSVWHPLVLRYFRERDWPSGLYHLLRTFLADRSVFVRSHAGQPSGFTVSPLLWNVVIDSLLSLRIPRAVVIQAYADDTIIIIPAPSRDALGDLASRVLRRVVNWSRALKLSLSCDKTFCVFFSHGIGGMKRVRPTIRLSPTDPTLQFCDTLRVLGVVFDRRLSFFHHADYLRQKVALIASRVATFFAMQRSYVSPVHKVLMYRQVILQALTYACPVWWGEDHVDCRLYARLVTVQRVALLALTRAYRTTSTAALQVFLHAPPIDLEIEPQWVADAHAHVPLHPAVPVAVPFVRLTSAQARAAARSTAVHIYTDGSFTNASAGAAFLAFGHDGRVFSVGRFRLNRATSAYTAEVVTFQEAIHHALAACYTLLIAFYTDCLSLLQALASPRNSEPHVLFIRELLRRISRRVPLHVLHVPGHAGIFGNEVADVLATRASSVGLEQRSRSSYAGRYTFCGRHAGEKPTRTQSSLGHGRFPHYFHRFNLMREARCPCGSYSLDMSHVLHACPITASHTNRIEPQDAYLTHYLMFLEVLLHLHTYTDSLMVSCKVAATGAIPVRHCVSAGLASQGVVCAHLVSKPVGPSSLRPFSSPPEPVLLTTGTPGTLDYCSPLGCSVRRSCLPADFLLTAEAPARPLMLLSPCLFPTLPSGIVCAFEWTYTDTTPSWLSFRTVLVYQHPLISQRRDSRPSVVRPPRLPIRDLVLPWTFTGTSCPEFLLVLPGLTLRHYRRVFHCLLDSTHFPQDRPWLFTSTWPLSHPSPLCDSGPGLSEDPQGQH
ncbi:hypothetical protein HPB52_023745 [Rhipicephalus sanguineus]|uniref:Tick transposon n=1 Tax=Rhipicephalus sanguineus TaxID=34632 RepID=A0A9D4Q3W3_RHISA|nr:hypothetical protein HPB52_023745 [Rhipicephalus sanguineus]